jgi:outer membrane receptor for ferrienterochelin and colicins
MKTMKMLRLGAAAIPLMLATPSLAEVADAAAAAEVDSASADEAGEPRESTDIIVNAEIVFRDRAPDPNPVLTYGLDYFQRFEPVSVGEMLKRVPGVTFTSDVLEYDGVQMRGLPPGFTQVLINGRRAPGGESDRSFFVDRLPAELIERIEIVRSPRADQPSEGIAGTLNVITKESANFEGGFAKLGALINKDGGTRPSGAIAYSGKLGPATSMWGAVNYQERRNPKKKVSLRYGDVFGGDGSPTDPDFNNTERQNDTRDGRDVSANTELTHEFDGGGRLRIGGLYVDTNRNEDETSLTYEGADLDFDGVETQHEDIHQKTYAITSDAKFPMGDFELGLAAAWNGYRENTITTASEGDEEDLSDLEPVEKEALHIRDNEYAGTISLTWGTDSPLRIKTGVDLLSKKRRGSDIVLDIEDDEEEADPAVNFTIKEKRYDPYLRFTYEPSSTLSIDTGVRYEITRRQAIGATGTERYNTESLNPSFHVRYALTDADQLRLSIARTVRRPSYDLISPYEQEESPGDDDITIGNPALKNERAWGIDVGYERNLGGRGIFGVNAFYRKVKDLTELVSTGVPVLDEDEQIGNFYTPRNIGDGKVWGLEVDFSAPLTVFGLPDTGLFFNYTYLDSSTRDPFTGAKRRFNNQPHHVYNLGFIQTVTALDASFGATISGRSKATESNFDETVDLRYDPDLEVFVEKRIGKNFVLRGTVQNLLDRKKKENFRKYDGDSYDAILAARAAGDIDEYELERERSGQLFQITLRAAF